MGWFSTLFSSKKIVDTAADGIYNGIDKLVYTKEEKAEATQKGLDLYLQFVKATKPAAKARRVIAFVITGMWSSLVALVVGLHLLGSSKDEFVFNILTDVVAIPFSIIIGFYFLKHVTSNLKQ
jgi:hypothetical protein